MRLLVVLAVALLVASGPVLADYHTHIQGVWEWFSGVGRWLIGGRPASGFAVAGGTGVGSFTAGSITVVELVDRATGERRPEAQLEAFLDNGGETAELALPLDSLTQELGGDGWLASQGAILRVRGVKQSATYDVRNDLVALWNTAVCSTYTGVIDPAIRRPFDACNDLNVALGSISCDASGGGYDRTVHLLPAGVKGHLVTPSIEYSAVVELSLDDGRILKAAVGSSTGRAEFKDPATGKILGSVTWTGNLVTGTPPPDPRDVVMVRKSDTGAWSLAALGRWEEYTAWGSTCRRPDDGWAGSKSSAYGALFTPVVLGGGGFTGDGNGYTVDLGTSRVVVPRIQIRIQGEVLGIGRAVGKPIVTATAAGGVKAGEFWRVDYTVKNNASVEGSFDVVLACGGAPLGVLQRVGAPAKGSVSGKFEETLAEAGQRSCTVQACAAGNICSTAALSVVVAAPDLCPTGGVRLEGLSVYQCDGKGYIEILQCAGAQSINTGPVVNSITGELISTGTFIDLVSEPEYKNGVWSCSGGDMLAGGQCQARRGTLMAQVAVAGCQFICDIGGLPPSLSVGAGAQLFFLDSWEDAAFVRSSTAAPATPVETASPTVLGGSVSGIGVSVVNYEQGTIRQVGCSAPRVPAAGSGVVSSDGSGVVSLDVSTASKVVKSSPVRAPAAPAAPSSKAPRPPGFEGVFAIAGLLAVGYLVSWRGRQRGGDRGG